MANAEMKIFEAEKLHQPMIAAVSIIPIMPLKRRRRRRQEVSFDEKQHSYSYVKCTKICETWNKKFQSNKQISHFSKVYQATNNHFKVFL